MLGTQNLSEAHKRDYQHNYAFTVWSVDRDVGSNQADDPPAVIWSLSETNGCKTTVCTGRRLLSDFVNINFGDSAGFRNSVKHALSYLSTYQSHL